MSGRKKIDSGTRRSKKCQESQPHTVPRQSDREQRSSTTIWKNKNLRKKLLTRKRGGGEQANVSSLPQLFAGYEGALLRSYHNLFGMAL